MPSLLSSHILSKLVIMTAQENEPLTPLNIITFNVNGLGLEAKRNPIFKYIRQKDSIVLLWETLSSKEIEKK